MSNRLLPRWSTRLTPNHHMSLLRPTPSSLAPKLCLKAEPGFYHTRQPCRSTQIPSDLTRPSRSLHGRVAIVTGAGALQGGVGNGRAAAVMLAEVGASVVCVDLKQDLAQHTVDMIEQENQGAAIAVSGDVTRADDCARIVSAAVERFGRLDILVNNVGVMGPQGSAIEVDMAAFMKGLEINVASMVQMAKFAIPEMVKNEGQWAGSIVNMGSVAGLKGGTPNILYPTSKGAVVNLTRGMAANHAAQRIRVNCVCPGRWQRLCFATVTC